MLTIYHNMITLSVSKVQWNRWLASSYFVTMHRTHKRGENPISVLFTDGGEQRFIDWICGLRFTRTHFVRVFSSIVLLMCPVSIVLWIWFMIWGGLANGVVSHTFLALYFHFSSFALNWHNVSRHSKLMECRCLYHKLTPVSSLFNSLFYSISFYISPLSLPLSFSLSSLFLCGSLSSCLMI